MKMPAIDSFKHCYDAVVNYVATYYKRDTSAEVSSDRNILKQLLLQNLHAHTYIWGNRSRHKTFYLETFTYGHKSFIPFI